ncbi:hypothetical protein JWG41_05850, partial [Leptospira sp. 201903075]|uniref:hypothetical protein n=1 Tax=Leptospira chreensis TaxID=2810035 RepID=UPI0019642FCB
ERLNTNYFFLLVHYQYNLVHLRVCIEANKIDSCKPKKFTLESFKVITNPYDEPSINIYLNNGVPDEFKEAFRNSRKLLESKVK